MNRIKYAINLMPVKFYKKGISCRNDTKRYHKSFPKASKVVFTMVCPI